MKKNLKVIVALIVGLFAGLLSGFFSSGGGMILVPFFTHYLKLEDIKARATTIFCIIFLVVTCSFFYMNQKYIDFNLGIKCAIGGCIGAVLGSKILYKIDKKLLNILFIIFLIYCAIKMII